MGITPSDGNVIFPSGNALKYLKEYFDLRQKQVSPYEENPEDVRAICIEPNGNVLGGNIYRTGILELIADYAPK